MLARTLTVAAAAALTLTLTATAAGAATTQIGSAPQFAANAAPDPGTANGQVLQGAAVGAAYAVPAGYGVITALRHRTGTTSGTLTFQVLRPVVGAPGSYLVVAAETRAVTAGVAHTFPVRVPVIPGDTLGIVSSTGVQMAYRTEAVGDQVRFYGEPGDPTPTVGQTVVASESTGGYQLNVAAVVETDADKDGFGDDTQDGCSTDARTTGKCAETTVTKKPKKVVLTRDGTADVTIKFRSPDPAGTFRCSVDGKKYKKCSSPLERTFGLGKHKVKIKAYNAQGVEELKAAVVKFRVQSAG